MAPGAPQALAILLAILASHAGAEELHRQLATPPQQQQAWGAAATGDGAAPGPLEQPAIEPMGAWCGRGQQEPARLAWSVAAPAKIVLAGGRGDAHSCAVLRPPAEAGAAAYVRVRLALQAAAPAPGGAALYAVRLLDCDASLWQLAGIQDDERTCVANTAALRASCNEWLLSPPAAGHGASESCAPPGTAFAHAGDLGGRVLVLQAHWRLKAGDAEGAVQQLPGIRLELGAAAAAAARPPALLGAFVGSGLYPPSSLSHSLQAFTVPAGAAPAASAELSCGRRCTYVPLGRAFGRPVNVLGYSFEAFDRAVSVSFKIKRGWAGRAAGPAELAEPDWQAVRGRAGGVAALDQPLQLYPGDVLRWRCTYNTSGLRPGSALRGGAAAAPAAQQEQCTLVLHYWPRVEAMRGCTAALLSDRLKGENMCSHEAQQLLEITGAEDTEFPMRRMYNEHSFPRGAWMGAWKATHILLQMAAVLSVLWGSHTLLSRCQALGSWHRRYHQLAPGQQRNVSLYITHLVLDTAALACVSRPMVELWLGLTETAADVRAGVWGFTYLVSCYALELTWRRRVDAMLAVHHVGTITIILLYAGELTPHTYRVANTIIVLAAFALMEQPTYVALLLKRMLPAHSPHVVAAARVGYLSWFALKGASVLIAATMFAEDWDIMPTWVRVNFLLTWVVASVVQGWSGWIQFGIYRGLKRAHAKAAWQRRQGLLKRRAAAALGGGGGAGGGGGGAAGNGHLSGSDGGDTDTLSSPLLTPMGSNGSDDDDEARIPAAAARGKALLTPSSSGESSGVEGRLANLDGFARKAGGGGGALGCLPCDLEPTGPGAGSDAADAAAGLAGLAARRGSGGSGGGGSRGHPASAAACGGGGREGSGSPQSSSDVSGGSSSARLYRHKAPVQRRSKSGLRLHLMEGGYGPQDS